MTEKLSWNTHLHCYVVIVNDTNLRVPRLLNPGGCMRPPHRLLVINKMFGYDAFEVICRRKYKTIDVIQVLASKKMPDNKSPWSVIAENRKLFTTLQEKNGRYAAAPSL